MVLQGGQGIHAARPAVRPVSMQKLYKVHAEWKPKKMIIKYGDYGTDR
jgi:hypothetical protein